MIRMQQRFFLKQRTDVSALHRCPIHSDMSCLCLGEWRQSTWHRPSRGSTHPLLPPLTAKDHRTRAPSQPEPFDSIYRT